jgi:SNF2 family DNA or RNA helicase
MNPKNNIKNKKDSFRCPRCLTKCLRGDIQNHSLLQRDTHLLCNKSQKFESSSKLTHLIKLLKKLTENKTIQSPLPNNLSNKTTTCQAYIDKQLYCVKSEWFVFGGSLKKLSLHLITLPTTTIRILELIIKNIKVNKVIVFSQWTSMLDIVEIPLTRDGIQYIRLDGSMNISARDNAIQRFNDSQHAIVLIMSLKAAAVGLNLVAANHVILLDPWWNPTLEEQAIDRAHRIGQTREVRVYRFVMSGTVEEKMVQMQKHKLNIFRWVLGGDQEQKTSQTTTIEAKTNLI